MTNLSKDYRSNASPCRDQRYGTADMGRIIALMRHFRRSRESICWSGSRWPPECRRFIPHLTSGIDNLLRIGGVRWIHKIPEREFEGDPSPSKSACLKIERPLIGLKYSVREQRLIASSTPGWSTSGKIRSTPMTAHGQTGYRDNATYRIQRAH
jgi:hypothetical protein